MDMQTVYLAGPLFSQAERSWNQRLAEELTALETTLRIILPQIECQEAVDREEYKEVVRVCLSGVESSRCVLAILDGADADAGTSFECGYAYAKGIPVIGIRTDIREGEDQGVSTMLAQTCRKIIRYPADNSGDRSIAMLAELVVEALRAVFNEK